MCYPFYGSLWGSPYSTILPHPCTLTLLCHINIRSTYFQGRYFYSYGNTKREQQVHRIRFEPYSSTLQSSNRRRIWSRNIQSAFISFPTPTHSTTVPVILLLILELHNTSSKAYGSVQYTRTSREYGRHREKAPPCSVLFCDGGQTVYINVWFLFAHQTKGDETFTREHFGSVYLGNFVSNLVSSINCPRYQLNWTGQILAAWNCFQETDLHPKIPPLDPGPST